MQLLNECLDSGPYRTIANNLAERAERSDILRGVQVSSTPVLDLADPRNFCMVVKDFGTKKMDFTGEQHAHNQGMHPILVPMTSQGSQRDNRALIGF